MMEKIVLMSKKEFKTEQIIKKVIAKKMKQHEAAKELKLSTRQIRRKVKAYRKSGSEGLISKKRGKASNRRLPEEFIYNVLLLIKEKYYDFGPTLATEKLWELDQIKISVETVRQLMIKNNFWKGKTRKSKKTYPLRERRPRIGELVQADASPHAWFEERRGKCALIVFVDDANSRLKLKFYEKETTQAYAETYQEYIHQYGVPLALYTDRHSIFEVNNNKKNLKNQTQFSRILSSVGTQLILASSPQAKGRVERNNYTLQDRLVKELRLRNINTIEEANKFLEDEYTTTINNKFMVIPKDPEDMHKPIKHTITEETAIFSIQGTRKVSNSLDLSYKTGIYQIKTKKYPNSIKQEQVLICESFTGNVKIYFKGEEMDYKIIEKRNKTNVQNSKTINHEVDCLVKNRALSQR